MNTTEKLFCTYVDTKQILDQNVHISISKKIFLIQILVCNA